VKVVFLDIDGVLNSLEFHQRDLGPLDRLDPSAVARLNALVRVSGAHVVISSSWRLSRTPREIRLLLEQVGFAGTLAGCTPDLSGEMEGADYDVLRASEVQAWLDRAVVPVEGFVVLDDAELDDLQPHLVRTSLERGLLDEHVDAALRLLSGETKAGS